MKKITEIAHDLLLEIKADTAVDFTCGRGFDTYFLATHCNKVYAFDIQEEAIEESKKKCETLTNVTFILDSHAQVKNYVHHFDIGIYNCGYLPHGDKKITTNAQEVIYSLKESLNLLNEKGRILVVLYPGFEEGKQEAIEVENFLTSLEGKNFDVFKIQVLNRKNVPYIIGIDKHGQ